MRNFDYVLRRGIFSLVTIFLAVTGNFFLFRLLPGDAVSNLAKVPHAGPELQHALMVRFGLDRSTWDQYLLYLKNLLHGDLGVSFTYQEPVSHLLLTDLENTVLLAGAGTLGAIVLGVLSGVVAAWRRSSPLDHLNTGLATLVYSFPAQWLGLVLLIIFAGVLPAGGMSDLFVFDSPPFWPHLADVGSHMVLPTATLILTAYGGYTLVVRSSMLETLGEDYVLTARAKGLSSRRIVWRHAVRNAMLPIVTMVALDLGYVVGGAVLVEVIFSWPGLGMATYTALGQRDYPMVQGGFLILTVSVILLNFLADLVYFRLDRRVSA
ncbi:ABC transporter permease [Amycolatopsis sp. NBC_00345]|uniref:ABC transporter permease n=1 Tax=Amycolatopsis sp. NBC_00345 TaxID=2975955 RepID=UPI002E269626